MLTLKLSDLTKDKGCSLFEQAKLNYSAAEFSEATTIIIIRQHHNKYRTPTYIRKRWVMSEL